MRFTLRQLEYFIAAGQTGSITLASERIHISQPSISTAIAHLERELSVQLFVRHHAQGLKAKALVEQAEGLYTLASEAGGQVRGPLSLGCMVTLAPMLVPELAHAFTTAFPATQIRYVEGDQEQLIVVLRRSETEVVLTYDLHVPDDIHFTPLVDLPPHVLVAEGHSLAEQAAVAMTDIVDEPMILLDLPLSREYFLALFMAEGLQPKIAARSAHQGGCGSPARIARCASASRA